MCEQTTSPLEGAANNEFEMDQPNPIIYGTSSSDVPQVDTLDEISSLSDTDKHTITIHRVNILEEMVSNFKTKEILDLNVSFTYVGEAGSDQNRVSREAYTAFWNEFFLGDAEGEESKVPAINAKWQEEEWMSVGRIIFKGFVDHAKLKLNFAFVVALVHGEEYVNSEIMLESFMSYICHSDREIVKEAITGNIETSFNEDIVDFLDRYGCKKIPVKEEMKPQIIQIAHKQLIQKPKYALDKMKGLPLSCHQHINHTQSLERKLSPSCPVQNVLQWTLHESIHVKNFCAANQYYVYLRF
ncbi:hypothetical protein KUTeg_015493 [Tegillarca granosa]|uniref:Uncharacterized protein n=1 Tax=Tegillarca granosa TaxID=220873 RepID=A0ABQ9EQV7_TEGGR|nr:hypothetical protein KUTeg_015493 [Tegillarca granosa]